MFFSQPHSQRQRRNFLFWILVTISLLVMFQCGKKEPEEPVVAVVGNRTISLTSFQRGYLPVILYGDKFDSPETRVQTLDYLIGDKLLAQEAEKIHLDTLPILKHVRRVAEHKAMARHLYDEWVREKISVPTEEELRQAFERINKQLFIRHLFAPSAEAADSLYALLESGRMTFEEIASRIYSDSLLASNGGALGWLEWGDLDENLENVAYEAPVGSFTKPVRSQYGWHILRVDDYKRQMIVSEDDFQQKKEFLKNRIYERREAVVSKQVMNEFMEAQNVRFDREITRPVFNAIIARRSSDETLPPEEQLGSPEREFATLEDELLPYLDQMLVTFAGEGWTVREFLDRLPEMDRRHFYGNLYVGLANMIRDELLGREAKARGYDQKPDVVEEVQDREDKLLSQLYLQSLYDTLTITEEIVTGFYEENWRQRYHGPDSLWLQEILVKNKDLADSLMYRLRSGANFEEMARRYSKRSRLRGKSGDLGWQVGGQTNFDQLYEAALKVQHNVPVGPVETADGWSIVRYTQQRRYPLPLDSIREKVRQDVENYRQAVVRNEALTKARSAYDIDRHDDVLNLIDEER
ncbi:MAG: peptidylprolyl isomerase [Candidatus Marinimicrobia bacterium]|nr:peptidylprolyl isomerase [Candidatus Neomarinimicrobiota bacterium]MCF7840478.1 peptidylprolyl isomerase [Candidatus Neomarinimicrobiota bacterium]